MLKLSTKNTAIFKNFTFLSIIQFVQLTVTFLTYPYLIKTLGQEKYGIIVYAQAIVGYFTIIINYGFNATATKEVALNKDDNNKLNEIVSSIFTAKLYLFLISLILFLVLVTNVKVLSYHKWIYLWTFLSTAGWVMFPDWYFQGIEKMQNLTYSLVISKLFSVAVIFLFIKNEAHFKYVPIINSLTMLFAGIIGLFLIKRSNKNIHFIISKFTLVKEQYIKGFAYFISNLAANSKDYLNTILVGTFLNYNSVAIYDLVNKIIKVLILPCTMFSRAIFPTITIKKSLSFNLKVGKLMFYYSLIACFLLFIIPKSIWSNLIKVDIDIFRYTLYILSLSLPLLSKTISKGFLTLVAFNEDAYYSKGILFSIAGYFIIIGLLIFIEKFNLYTAAATIIVSLLLEILYYNIRIKKIKKLITQF